MIRPEAMGVVYQENEEADIFRILSDENVVRIETLKENSESVISRLRWISSSKQFSALIDVGASITGLNNKEVAASLLLFGLEAFDGVIYLDAKDRKQVLLRKQNFNAEESLESTDGEILDGSDTPLARSPRSPRGASSPRTSSRTSPRTSQRGSPRYPPRPGMLQRANSLSVAEPEGVGRGLERSEINFDRLRSSSRFQGLLNTAPVPLERCGVPTEKLFVFFDQTHSTGAVQNNYRVFTRKYEIKICYIFPMEFQQN